MIKLQVIGNLGKDAVTNNVNGKNVINFNVAHTEKYKDASGMQKERTTWVECSYWTDRIAVAPYLKKGTQVYVEGTPDVRLFNRADGTSGSSLTMRVLTVQLLGGGVRSEGSAQGSGYGNTGISQQPYADNSSASLSPQSAGGVAIEDDLPF